MALAVGTTAASRFHANDRSKSTMKSGLTDGFGIMLQVYRYVYYAGFHAYYQPE